MRYETLRYGCELRVLGGSDATLDFMWCQLPFCSALKYITEAGSLDPMLEFARKPSEAANGGWRDTPPHFQREASRET